MLVISGDPDRVRRAKEIAEEIDVPGSAGVMPPGALPSSDLEFTVYMLAGQSKGDASIGVPKALDGTVSQLRAIFPYASYHLLDTAVLRVGGDSGGEVRGFLPPIGEATDSGSYSIAAVVRGVVPKEHESEISVREFHCFLNLPDGHNGRFDVNVKTTLELREGQQVVVGKAGMGNAGTLFVVVSARVLK
jgi:hypothetical protein